MDERVKRWVEAGGKAGFVAAGGKVTRTHGLMIGAALRAFLAAAAADGVRLCKVPDEIERVPLTGGALAQVAEFYRVSGHNAAIATTLAAEVKL